MLTHAHFLRSVTARSSLSTLRMVRLASTTPPPPRQPVSPTTFSEKSSPRNVHDRPEQIRGFPPSRPLTASADSKPFNSAANGSESGPLTEHGAAGHRWTSNVVEEEAFDGPSRPRLLYSRQPRRDLPNDKNKKYLYIASGLLVLTAWGLFLLYATNAERLASSVMRSLTFHLRNSVPVRAVLGNRVKLEEPWYVLGDPWISGNVNTMQGRVDLSFRVTGDKQSGTIYFTSIRPSQSDPWRIIRYKLITDSGETIQLENNIDKV